MPARALLSCLFLLLSGASTLATSLRVTPVLVEIPQPGLTSALTLRNEDAGSLNIQIRVMRWSQKDGVEKLDPTADVVASPPFAVLDGNRDYTVRIVRVAKSPVTQEESYRVLIDQIPDSSAKNANTVSFVLRYSIPVFFAVSGARGQPDLQWSIQPSGGKLLLIAANSGSRHVRLANLKLSNNSGNQILRRDGLVGYVLPGSSMRWPLQLAGGTPMPSGPVNLAVDSETRPINATIAIRARP